MVILARGVEDIEGAERLEEKAVEVVKVATLQERLVRLLTENPRKVVGKRAVAKREVKTHSGAKEARGARDGGNGTKPQVLGKRRMA